MAMRSVGLAGWMRVKRERPVDAELATLRAELVRFENAGARDAYEQLLAGTAGQSDEYKEYIARYVRGRLELTGGPDQYLFPMLGLVTTVIGLPIAIAAFWWFSTFTDWRFRPFGVGIGLFYAVIFAGTAGGVLRVLYGMVREKRTGDSELQLYFEGLTHPLIGMILATALMMGFNSKFIATPVPQPDELVLTSSGWTQAQMFMVFAGFAAGFFEEQVLRLIGRAIPGQKKDEPGELPNAAATVNGAKPVEIAPPIEAMPVAATAEIGLRP